MYSSAGHQVFNLQMLEVQNIYIQGMTQDDMIPKDMTSRGPKFQRNQVQYGAS